MQYTTFIPFICNPLAFSWDFTSIKIILSFDFVIHNITLASFASAVGYLQQFDSKWLEDLNIRQDTIKLLEKNVGKTFSDISCTNVFLGQSPKGIEIKAKINKWDLIKLIIFCTAKETINKTEKQTHGLGENICKWCDLQGFTFQNIQIAHTT